MSSQSLDCLMVNPDPPENPHFAPSRCVAIKLTRKLAKNPSKSTFQQPFHIILLTTIQDNRLMMFSVTLPCSLFFRNFISHITKVVRLNLKKKTWILVESASWSRVQTAIGSSAKSAVSTLHPSPDYLDDEEDSFLIFSSK